MSSTFDVVGLLTMLAPSLPLYIVWLVGTVVPLARRDRHPQVSLLAAPGFLLLLLTSVVGTVAWFWVVHERSQHSGWTMEQTRFASSTIALVRFGLSMIGHVLLLIALFGWRFQPLIRPAPLGVNRPILPRDSNAIQSAD
jgi:hypothetical protein